MELYKGRPQNIEGRLDREVRVYDLLDSLGIEYLRTDHGYADTMEACNEIDKVLDVLICKNLFLCNRQKTKFYLLMNFQVKLIRQDFLLRLPRLWKSTLIFCRGL